MTTSSDLDFTRIPESGWVTVGFSADGAFRYDRHTLSDGRIVQRTVNLVETELIERNKQRFNDSHGQRFGDGRVVASIPMNVFLRDFAPRLKEGDRDFNKWWLNNEQNRQWRTFRGKI